MHTCRSSLLVLILLAPCSATYADNVTIELKPPQGKPRAVPMSIDVTLPRQYADFQVVRLVAQEGKSLYGQLTKPGIGSQSSDPLARELHVVLPPDMVGSAPVTWQLSLAVDRMYRPLFRWQPGEKHDDLVFEKRPVLRYMHEAVDDSSKERRDETMKVYHHLWDPSGEHLLTKGPGGLFQHHRGIFYGFNKISYVQDGEKKSADVWHCRNGESQVHLETVMQESGPIMARHLVKIGWNGRDGKRFATELRELTVYNVQGAQVVEFASKLESEVDDLKLDGDPQHAGFQFRATQYVPDNTADKTFYIRPDGKGEPGKYRNWPGDGSHADLAWNAMNFVAHDQEYTCCYLDRPENPKPARFSERNYGRFGSYFATEVSKEPLYLNYRLWLQPGELGVDEIAQLSSDFVTPPNTTVKP